MKIHIKQGSTHFLRASIVAIGLVALAFGIFVVPSIGRGIPIEFPSVFRAGYVAMVCMYAAVIPFAVILWQGMRLLGLIDRNSAFSHASIEALRQIKLSAVSIGLLYWIMVPFVFFPIAQADDAPGLIIFGAVIASVPFVFAVFASLLQKLLQSAIDMKSENDLTV